MKLILKKYIIELLDTIEDECMLEVIYNIVKELAKKRE